MQLDLFKLDVDHDLKRLVSYFHGDKVKAKQNLVEVVEKYKACAGKNNQKIQERIKKYESFIEQL